MIVTCPACSSRYRIREEKIQGRGARITCPSCGHKFVVEKESAASGSQGVPVAVARGPVGGRRAMMDEDDEADVPTTVMPHGSQLAQTMKAAAEAAKAARQQAEAADAGRVGAPSISPAGDRPAAVVTPAPGRSSPAKPAGGGSRVVLVALLLVGLVVGGLLVVGLLGAGS